MWNFDCNCIFDRSTQRLLKSKRRSVSLKTSGMKLIWVFDFFFFTFKTGTFYSVVVEIQTGSWNNHLLKCSIMHTKLKGQNLGFSTELYWLVKKKKKVKCIYRSRRILRKFRGNMNESLFHHSAAWQKNTQRNNDSHREAGQTNDLIGDKIQDIWNVFMLLMDMHHPSVFHFCLFFCLCTLFISLYWSS